MKSFFVWTIVISYACKLGKVLVLSKSVFE
jgi:hypothetical protein